MEKEIVICAAIRWGKRVIRGHRHHDCYRSAIERGMSDRKSEEGFITSKNRFVTREEGLILQKAADIKSVNRTGYDESRLFSEDLY